MLTKQVAVICTERDNWDVQQSRFDATVWHGRESELRLPLDETLQWIGEIDGVTVALGQRAGCLSIFPSMRCAIGVTQIAGVCSDAYVFLRSDEAMQRVLKGRWNPFVSDVVFADLGMQCLAVTVEYDESQWVIIGHDGKTLARWEKPKPPKSSKRFHPVVWSGSE